MPGGGRSNAQHFSADVESVPGLNADLVTICHDPQTSGGLLASVAPEAADAADAALQDAGVPAVRIGVVVAALGRRVVLQ